MVGNGWLYIPCNQSRTCILCTNTSRYRSPRATLAVMILFILIQQITLALSSIKSTEKPLAVSLRAEIRLDTNPGLYSTLPKGQMSPYPKIGSSALFPTITCPKISPGDHLELYSWVILDLGPYDEYSHCLESDLCLDSMDDKHIVSHRNRVRSSAICKMTTKYFLTDRLIRKAV